MMKGSRLTVVLGETRIREHAIEVIESNHGIEHFPDDRAQKR